MKFFISYLMVSNVIFRGIGVRYVLCVLSVTQLVKLLPFWVVFVLESVKFRAVSMCSTFCGI